MVGIPAALAEQTEAESLYDVVGNAPADVIDGLGITARRVGGGVALSAPNDPSQYWSKALGFGFDEPVTAALMREVTEFYRAAGTPLAVLQLAPAVLPPDWAAICAETGLEPGRHWVKLVGETERVAAALPEPKTELVIRQVEPADAGRWAQVMLDGFGMPDGGVRPMLAAMVGRPELLPLAAWDADDLVATGAMRTHQSVGHVFCGATLPQARGRGAQSALIAARVQAASAAGLRWLVTETGAEEPGSHNSSLHNMYRAGFELLYERQNWIFRA
jgi:ribosomal protein S18 acetylase RimI-like enzyme